MRPRTPIVETQWLSDRDLEALTGRARRTWQKDRLFGRGPRYCKIGGFVRYNIRDLEAWLATRPAGGGVPERIA
jgi:hypothetical protein